MRIGGGRCLFRGKFVVWVNDIMSWFIMRFGRLNDVMLSVVVSCRVVLFGVRVGGGSFFLFL